MYNKYFMVGSGINHTPRALVDSIASAFRSESCVSAVSRGGGGGGGDSGCSSTHPHPYDIGANYLHDCKNIQQFNHEVHMKIAVLLVPHVLNIDQHNRRG